MRAIVITRPGGPEVLELRDVPDPLPGPWEVRVKVRASAVNRADLLQARGHYPAPPGSPRDIPGLEYAGEVESVGPHVTRVRPGDRVMGLCGGGAFAELLTVHEREVVPFTHALCFEDAAALPEAFVTAWDALVAQGGMRSGEAVLIHAAGSGVGTAAVQLARVLGARPIGTSRSKEKLQVLEQQLGLPDWIVAGKDGGFADEVKRMTGGRGADLALELVGGAYLPQTLEALAPRGRLVLVGLLAGARAELDLRAVLSRRLSLRGTVLRSRPLEEKIEAALAFERHLLPLFLSGQLRPVVDEVVPMAEVARAFERLASNASFGKIVLRW